jgi:hypothetical protein
VGLLLTPKAAAVEADLLLMPKVAAVEVGLLRMHKAEVVEVGLPRTRRVAAGEVVKAAAPACGAKAEADLRFSRAWVVAKVLSSSVAAARVVMSSVEDPTSAAARMCVCARALTCVSGGGAIAGAIATVITDHVLACTSRADVVGVTGIIGNGACSAIVIPIATGGIATGVGGNTVTERGPLGGGLYAEIGNQ